ncbi:CD276 antigen-like protein [Labeo rohita]|uniref:CD276 antigen-like protein n=1 Tax=Labeo rohita TaxID=84645 RepID=A0A498LQM6_LABRO|nr:CD276 antigen-like protein [Labeo rohita]
MIAGCTVKSRLVCLPQSNLSLSPDSFSVTVPSSPVLAVRGATALLSCKFDPDPDISNLVITWQRQENTQVVHSFYYNSDQLERQSPDFFNRTALNHKELAEGNASLSIANIRLKDAGYYLCIVSSNKGTDRGLVQLVYEAFYSEPRLSILFKPTSVIVQYEMEGYPKPEIMWLGSGGQNLTNHLEVSSESDGGLYYFKSSYVTQSPEFNVTFMLKNPAAHQELQRRVNLSYGVLLWLYCREKRR